MPRRSAKKKLLKIKSREVKKKLPYIILTALLFSFSCLVLAGGVIYKRVSTVFVSAQSSDSDNTFQTDIYTLLIGSVDKLDSSTAFTKNLSLVVVNKSANELTMYKIDPNTSFDVPGKFGKEQASKIYTLGLSAFDDPKEASLFLTKAIENNIRLKINSYLLVENSQFELISDTFLHPGLFNFTAFGKNIALNSYSETLQTNITEQQAYTLFKTLSASPNIIEKEFKDWEEASVDYSYDSPLAKDRLVISVLNGSGLEGAGARASEVITASGGRVTYVGNSKESYNSGILVTDDPTSQSARYLKDFFKIDQIETRAKFSFIEPDCERSDITIILGVDFEKIIY